MRPALIALAIATLFTTSACAGGPSLIPPTAVATADHVSLTAENALTAANRLEDAFVLRVEAHVQDSSIHGPDAERLRLLIVRIGGLLNAADAGYRLGNDALVRAKTGDVIGLIDQAFHDFPALGAAIPH